MHLTSPADELADIRAEIQRLKRREAELRAAYLTRTDMPKVGRWFKVELITQRARVFDPRLLPDAIRHNPAYSRDKVTRVLKSSRLMARPVLPDLVAPEEADRLAAALRKPAPRSRFLEQLLAH